MAQQIKGKQIAAQTVTISGTTGNVSAIGNLDMTQYQVLVANYPTVGTALANKAYVDAIAQGVSPHAPVRVVATGQTSLSGLTTIDGASLSANDSVLLAGQTDKRENGLWLAKTPGGWLRRPDADGDPDNEVELGDFVFVESGLTNANSGWVLGKTDSPDMPIQPGVETQEWYKMAAPGSYTTDGEGIVLEGATFKLALEGATLFKSGSGLKLADGLSTAITGNTYNLSVETSRATSADASLTTKISTEISDRTSGDASLTTKLSTEISDRTSGDASLTTKVSTEISDRTSADISLSSAVGGGVSTETSLRESADASLTTKLSTEISDRTSGDASLTTKLSTTVSERASGDASLTTKLSTEISDRASADSSISTAVAAVDDITSNMISGQLVSYNGTTLTGTTNLFPSLSSSISTEISDRTSADASLTTAISTKHAPAVHCVSIRLMVFCTIWRASRKHLLE